ncbi:MAG: sugar phosphate isomerase/epimerase [Lentisphaeria bacterium]|nr:sugar phosphate isomerase/epimerase [Lentisphaeria bacterium]
MFLTGFTDEAGADLATQIRATQELGWKFFELRKVDGKTLASMSDAEFDELYTAIGEAGIQVNCYGSEIANWKKHPRKEEDFQASIDELLAAIPRMHKLGTKLVRGMSFVIAPDEQPDSPELEQIIFKKVRRLVEICADNGIVYGHENCRNYGGMSYLHTLKLLENVNHENLKLIYDTGNPCTAYRRIGTPPYPLQSSWEFYRNVREHIVYVHIKDFTALPNDDLSTPARQRAFAGDGTGDVRAIVRDLRETGYDGGFSMEPHIAWERFGMPYDNEDDLTVRYKNYITYAKRFENLLRDCGWEF